MKTFNTFVMLLMIASFLSALTAAVNSYNQKKINNDIIFRLDDTCEKLQSIYEQSDSVVYRMDWEYMGQRGHYRLNSKDIIINDSLIRAQAADYWGIPDTLVNNFNFRASYGGRY